VVDIGIDMNGVGPDGLEKVGLDGTDFCKVNRNAFNN
jgi:hypothetical protein